MDKRVFRKFMREGVIQKSVIFASAFGLSITKWHGSDENAEFPYRIYFYHGQNPVGYMDATVRQLGDDLYPSSTFPFEFFTPMGIMKGEFSSHFECFSYDIEEKNNNFDKVHGLLKIHTSQEIGIKNYVIGSYIKLESQNDPLLHVSFNNCVNQAEFTVESNQHFCEGVRYQINSSPQFVHYNYLDRNQKEKLAEISFTQDHNSRELIAKYDFPTTDSYQNVIGESNPNIFVSPIWRMVREVDLKDVWRELENNDPRFIEFLNEVREEMIIYPNKSKPISLYDRMATLCFGSPKYQNSFNLARAQRENLGLEDNSVLKRMREYRK